MPVETYDLGDAVQCDFCDQCYNEEPNKSMVGGFLFGSKAACPKCEKRLYDDAKKFGELHHIKVYCGPDETFRDFCLRLRDGNNEVKVYTGPDVMEVFKTTRKFFSGD